MDSTSLERLAALKRQLPQKLPLPQEKPAQQTCKGRHPLETTQDPQEFFRELMKASPDGHIPDHLLARMGTIEQEHQDQMKQNSGEELTSQQEQYRVFEQLLEDED